MEALFSMVSFSLIYFLPAAHLHVKHLAKFGGNRHTPLPWRIRKEPVQRLG
jgi:hypothetical protein